VGSALAFAEEHEPVVRADVPGRTAFLDQAPPPVVRRGERGGRWKSRQIGQFAVALADLSDDAPVALAASFRLFGEG
jgi:hypothetical protein